MTQGYYFVYLLLFVPFLTHLFCVKNECFTSNVSVTDPPPGWRIWEGGSGTRPQVQLFSFSFRFRENFDQIISDPTLEVGAPIWEILDSSLVTLNQGDHRVFTDVLFLLGVWLAAFNSVANPFVYALLMPTYRKCVINTFCPCARVTKPEASKESSVQTATSLA